MSVAFVAACPRCSTPAAWREEEAAPRWQGDGWHQDAPRIDIDCKYLRHRESG